jgi:hypothetical protein
MGKDYFSNCLKDGIIYLKERRIKMKKIIQERELEQQQERELDKKSK